MSFLARLFQGISDAMISVAVESIIALEWPEKQELYLGYNAMSDGVACSFGPLLGVIVYDYLDYVWTFMFFTVYIMIIGGVSVNLIPARHNQKSTDTDEDS